MAADHTTDRIFSLSLSLSCSLSANETEKGYVLMWQTREQSFTCTMMTCIILLTFYHFCVSVDVFLCTFRFDYYYNTVKLLSHAKIIRNCSIRPSLSLCVCECLKGRKFSVKSTQRSATAAAVVAAQFGLNCYCFLGIGIAATRRNHIMFPIQFRFATL